MCFLSLHVCTYANVCKYVNAAAVKRPWVSSSSCPAQSHESWGILTFWFPAPGGCTPRPPSTVLLEAQKQRRPERS